ncbi:MAG: alginate export family protein [Halioglobus sp.]|nr:alginate export family protein [Halioglobus sp.]
MSFQSGTYRNAAFFVEVEDIRDIIADDFNAGAGNTPGRSEFPVVADPEGTEINQAYLDYNGITGTRLRLGRQRINLDNQRFVGGVGWRQNEQTYDALSADWSNDRARAFYAAVRNVNRIFGDDVAAGDHRQAPSHLLNLSADVSDLGRAAVYHYVIDNEDEPAFSTLTTGVRLSGDRPLPAFTLAYLAEYARQGDFADNPRNYSADYWHLNAAATVGALTLTAGWEVLSGDADNPGEAFRTPLATLHAFNGWADQFLATPQAGLDDRYLRLGFDAGDWTLEARAHRFEAEDGNGDFGSEFDVHAGRKFGRHLQFDVFAAAFDGDNGFSDVLKIWLMVSARL